MQTNSIEHAYHELMAFSAKPTARAIRERLGAGSKTAIVMTSRQLGKHTVGGLPKCGLSPTVANITTQKE